MAAIEKSVDVVVIGAGAAGLMCAATAAWRGRQVLVIDHANKAGKKILMSGGGRCNFTNLNTTPANFVSTNPSFCISALKRYPPASFVELVERHGVEYCEKAPGQLFCVNSSKDILDVLLTECDWSGASVQLDTSVHRIDALSPGFRLETSVGVIRCESLVIATGGLSIPTMGASGFGYQVAEQFGLAVLPVRAGLVPFTLQPEEKAWLAPLSGVSVDVRVRLDAEKPGWDKANFREPMLITHRGLSGPVMLQVSSYWQPGQTLHIDLLPDLADVAGTLRTLRGDNPQSHLHTWLASQLPKRLAVALAERHGWNQPMQHFGNSALEAIAAQLKDWQIRPGGTEGYRTAEVTLGGVDTSQLSSRTFMVESVPGLHMIGEVLDVTGQLGGYNFQWAWASGWCAGQVV